MLIELTIHNIVLIEDLTIEFGAGLNALTGETGSGKSIVVDCMNLVLGGRADRELIRAGKERGFIQALFDVRGNDRVLQKADEMGIQCDDALLIVSRELSRSGRNICRVCGSVVPLSDFKQLTGMLLDIHGQHEHQSLMQPAKHIEYLDMFGDAGHRALAEEISALYSERSGSASALKKAMSRQRDRERLVDMLTHQISEIRAAKLKPDEEQRLTTKLRVLENSERIRGNIDTAYELTYRGHSNAQENLQRAASLLREIEKYDAGFSRLAERLDEVFAMVQDIGYELQNALETVESNPQLAEKIEKRLQVLDRLERKYGPTVQDVLDFVQKAESELRSIEQGDEEIETLRQKVSVLDAQLLEKAMNLSEKRKALADWLEANMHQQLSALGMERAVFKVKIDPLEKPNAQGLDQIEFLIAANPGEGPRPLAAVASGGEISRVMLAFKALSAQVDNIDAMVFDEIDTGVSGRMALAVGRKMHAIAKTRQVFCVTHLPQIAAEADWQYLVEKQTDGETTKTNVTKLDTEGRVRELSRLIGGEDSKSSLEHARHMLESV